MSKKRIKKTNIVLRYKAPLPSALIKTIEDVQHLVNGSFGGDSEKSFFSSTVVFFESVELASIVALKHCSYLAIMSASSRF